MITSEQLDVVKDCAARCAKEVPWPNEKAVYERVFAVHNGIFNAADLWVLQFCAEEVAHQQEGAQAVAWFYEAWKHAQERKRHCIALNLQTLSELAGKIEPLVNAHGGYRTTHVTIRNLPAGTAPEYIERDMAGFAVELAAYIAGEREDGYGRPLSAAGLYEAFEVIHPRTNGNGREGKIIYNWLLDKLEAPSFPPEPARFRQ